MKIEGLRGYQVVIQNVQVQIAQHVIIEVIQRLYGEILNNPMFQLNVASHNLDAGGARPKATTIASKCNSQSRHSLFGL